MQCPAAFAVSRGTYVANPQAEMGFLDDIQQRSPETRERTARPAVVQDLSRNGPSRVIPSEVDPGPAGSDRLHKGVTWVAVLVVAATMTCGVWLGLRHGAIANAAKEKASASAQDGAAVPNEAPAPAPAAPSARSKLLLKPATVRRAARAAEAINAEAINTVPPDSTSDVPTEAPLPAIEALNGGADVADSEVPTVEAAPLDPGPVLVALLDDENVYSGASAGIVAPRLVSLGFAEPLMNGFDVRTSSIELLVSKNGSVEHAKLFAPSHSMEDAMLLSRAKAFRFVPAQRDGFPVRYRLVLEVEATP
jgi:hypothetical protein